jgi:hypothetical protein
MTCPEIVAVPIGDIRPAAFNDVNSGAIDPEDRRLDDMAPRMT